MKIILKYKSEVELVNELKAQNVLAFKQLYRMYSRSLFAVIYKIIKEPVLAEDELQEVFIKIFNSVGNYDTTKGCLFTWMLNVARNSAIDHTRSKAFKHGKRNNDIADQLNYIDAQKRTSYNTDTIGLRQLTSTLPKDQFTVLDLTFFKGYTHVEAAKILNLPIGTVKTRIRYGIKNLRRSFNDPKSYKLSKI